MAQEKKMDQLAYGEIAKEVTSFGELLRSHQDEKQTLMDDFDKERDRYHKGKISKKALISSAKKVNSELKKTDRTIKKDIKSLEHIAGRVRRFAVAQYPRTFHVSAHGIKRTALKRKKHRKK